MKNLQEILKYAMDMELRAKEFYTFYKEKLNNKSLKLMFESLADMEDEHYNILKKQLDNLTNNAEVEELDLSQAEGVRIIEEKAKELKNLSEDFDVSELPILRMAYAMESDFASYYQRAAEATEDLKAKKLLETLAEWEIHHRDDFASAVEIALENTWFSQGFAPF